MAKSKFANLSLDKLVALRAEVDAAIAGKKRESRKKVVDEVKKLLAKNDMSLDDLPGKAPRKRTVRRKVAPKYRDPKNKAQTWTGRGRKPKWVEAHLKSGRKLTDLLIK